MGVSAVIPHRNSGRLLDRCLDALALAAGIEEVIVVDEVSADGSADRAVADPAVQLLRSDRPGFAAAINTGVAAARGDFVLLLGSDVFVRKDTVARLVRRLEHDSGLAVCGAALV